MAGRARPNENNRADILRISGSDLEPTAVADLSRRAADYRPRRRNDIAAAIEGEKIGGRINLHVFLVASPHRIAARHPNRCIR
jgi:hypothetical protein